MTSGTVIVTAVGNFIGYHVARQFAASGYRVIGSHHTPLSAMDPLRRARIAALRPTLAALVSLDITRADSVRALIAATRPCLWIHQAGLGANFASEDYDLAAANSINLLPLDPIFIGMGEIGGAVLITGSGMEYGAIASPHAEAGECLPESPYGLSRLAATLRTRQLAYRYRVPTRVARLYTVFGELDRDDRLVTRLIRRLARGEAVGLAPEVARDVCDVSDVALGYVRLAADVSHGSMFDIFNLSRGTPIPLVDLARLAARELGADDGLIFQDPSMLRVDEPPVMCGDSRKALARLSWTPRPLAEGLARLAKTEGRSALRV
jgi:nucleoside-diphosphate-sugar epimerase